jgi:hypothetical protein
VDLKSPAPLWDKHPAIRSGSALTFGERAADMLKKIFGTWSLLFFILGGILFWLLWIHDPGDLHLNLILSCMAAVQGVILQIASNRGDRVNAEVALHTQDNTSKLLEINEQQLVLLHALQGINDRLDRIEMNQSPKPVKVAGVWQGAPIPKPKGPRSGDDGASAGGQGTQGSGG